MGTMNYELEGGFRETQYVPIFPSFYQSQGFSDSSLLVGSTKLYLGSLKYDSYLIKCCFFNC